MRKIALGLGGVLTLVLALGVVLGNGSATADNGPHQEGQSPTTDACAGCHRAHTGQAAYLLKTDEVSLCTTCHDGSQATTNVLDGLSTGGGALRAGGFNNASINSADQTFRISVSCTGGVAISGYPSLPAGDTVCVNAATTPVAAATVTTNRLCGAGDPRTPTNYTSNCTAYWQTSTYQTPGSWPLKIGVLTTVQPVTSKHNVGEDGTTVWGSGPLSTTANAGLILGATTALECSSCHDQHGNGQYRILRPVPNLSGIAGAFSGVVVPDACPSGNSVGAPSPVPTSTDPISSGVVVTSCNSGNQKSYTTDNYMNATYVEWTTGMGLPQITGTPGAQVPGYPAEYTFPSSGSSAGKFTPNLDGMWPSADGGPGYVTGISAWCAQCHQRYLGRSVYAKSSTDPIFTYRHSSEGTMAYNGRQCITCHVAHGTNANSNGGTSGHQYADSVPLPGGTPQPGANQNSRLLKMDNRGMCQKCHGL